MPTVEYLATLAKHSAVVNVVRWSPRGLRLFTPAKQRALL
jgi:hypothetical protein